MKWLWNLDENYFSVSITATGEDNANKCVYLLDEELAIDRVGYISATVCKQVANAISESSYRATARQISEQTGVSISAQGAWNLVHGMGKFSGLFESDS